MSLLIIFWQIAKNKGTEEGEEQLDFEAEDGECGELEQSKDEAEERTCAPDEDLHEEPKESKELEEGEVTDEDDVRPEETEPRPVCRFFSRGQCTWGASCRFLHPGVTDKGEVNCIFYLLFLINYVNLKVIIQCLN